MRHGPPRDDDEADPVLRKLGYRSDPPIYRARIARIEALRREGRGPGAFLDRFLAECRAAEDTAARHPPPSRKKKDRP